MKQASIFNLLGIDCPIKNEAATETEYVVVLNHHNGSGDIMCCNCGVQQIIYGESKARLQAQTLRCKYCGARFTKMIKADISA